MTISTATRLMQHIDKLDYFFGFFTEKSEYAYINHAGLNWLGFKSLREAEGKDHSMIPCAARELAPEWIEQDKYVLKKNTAQFLGLNHYADDEWRLVHGEKTVSTIGHSKEILCVVRDISHYPDACLHPIIKNILNKFLTGNLKQFSHPIVEELHPELTQRQSECLFFLIHGYTAKETAKLLSLSYRTIEKYLDTVKVKLQCGTKNELIDKSMDMGLNKLFLKNLIKIQNTQHAL